MTRMTTATKQKARKVVVLGAAGVGKTSVVSRLTGGVFTTAYTPTIDTSHVTSVTADRLHSYQLQLMDTAGLDQLSQFPSSYAVNVDAYVLVYSVTSMESFVTLQLIYENLLNANGLTSGRFPVVLVANKADMRQRRVVDESAGWALAARWTASYVETSARSGHNVGRLLHVLAARLRDADEGRYLMSSCRGSGDHNSRRWWRRLTCTSSAACDAY